MGRNGYTFERVSRKLRKAEIGLGRGLTTRQMCRKSGIWEQTYYRSLKRHGGMQLSQAKRLKELEQENGRFKKR